MTSRARRKERRPGPGHRRLLIAAGGLLALALVGWGAWTALQFRADAAEFALLEAHLPPVPTVGEEWPGAFQRRLDSAMQRTLHGPERGAALDELSALYHSNGFLDEAIATYRAWLELHPREPKAAYRLAVLLGGFGMVEETLPLLDIVMAEAPDYPQGGVRKGELLLKSNRPEEALAIFRQVLAHHPDAVDARMGVARTFILQERWREAGAELDKVNARYPNYGPAWSARATVHQRLGETEALAVARIQGEQNRERGMLPDPWIDATYAHCFDNYRLRVAAFAYMPTDHSQREFAIGLLRRALSLNPQDLLAWRQLGTYLYQLQQMPEARRILERILSMDSDNPQSWINLISFLEDTGDRETARRLLSEARMRHPDDAALTFLEGYFLAEDGHWRAAIAVFEQAEGDSTHFVRSMVERARAHMFLGEFRRAVRVAEQALAAEPSHPMATTLVTESWIELRDRERAQDWVQRTFAHERIPAERREHLFNRFTAVFGSPPAL